MDNVNIEVEILRKYLKEKLEIKTNCTEMKNAFSGLIGRLDMAKERISELEDRSDRNFSHSLSLREKKN